MLHRLNGVQPQTDICQTVLRETVKLKYKYEEPEIEIDLFEDIYVADIGIGDIVSVDATWDGISTSEPWPPYNLDIGNVDNIQNM